MKCVVLCAAQVLVKDLTLWGKNTTNLWHHLKRKHEEEYKKISSAKLPRKHPHDNAAEKTVIEIFDKVKKWKDNESRSTTTDKMILEMIATDDLPFTIVQNIGFQRLISKRYTIKSEKFYRTKVLHQIYRQVCDKIIVMLSDENAGPAISFTTDCWSSPTESMMSLTAHYIDNQWKRVQLVLNVKPMHGSHTGQ